MNGDSEGRAGLNLRGLGDNRTLTLVDGRRLMPVNGNGETDLNVIPPALIESVEIVTGGGSAVYGSDAIAGVVNFRLRREFDGVELGGRWGQTDRGDGEEYDVSLTAGTGFADGRGSVIGYVGYYDRAQINQPAREFSRAPLFYVGPGDGITGPDNAYVGFGSYITEEGAADVSRRATRLYSTKCSQSTDIPRHVPQDVNPIGFNTDGTLFTMGNGDPGQRRKFPRSGRSLDLELLFPHLQLREFRRPADAADADVGLRVRELRPDRRRRAVRRGHLRRLHGQHADCAGSRCRTSSCRPPIRSSRRTSSACSTHARTPTLNFGSASG